MNYWGSPLMIEQLLEQCYDRAVLVLQYCMHRFECFHSKGFVPATVAELSWLTSLVAWKCQAYQERCLCGSKPPPRPECLARVCSCHCLQHQFNCSVRNSCSLMFRCFNILLVRSGSFE